MTMSPDDQQVIEKLRRYGGSFSQIAAAVGCTYETAWKYAHNIKRGSETTFLQLHSPAPNRQTRSPQSASKKVTSTLTALAKDRAAIKEAASVIASTSPGTDVPSANDPPKHIANRLINKTCDVLQILKQKGYVHLPKRPMPRHIIRSQNGSCDERNENGNDEWHYPDS